MVVLLALLLGLALGALAAWQLARSRAGEAFRPELARLEAERQAAVDRARSIEESDERVQALAAEALRRNNSSFLELAQTQLTPIAETLKRFDEKTQALDQERQRAYGSLIRQVQTLGESQERLRIETGNLRTALRAPHVRGRWGEIQLRRVVELAGMLPHCDFEEQTSATTDDGRMLRPDLVVNLPGGKHVVIDAKAPLAAYLDALDSEDEAGRRTHLQGHARQVREHIAKLGQKRYWEQFDPSPEFVIMFLPDETFFRVACEVDASLIELGPESGVLPASPTTLIGLLKTLAYAWQQETAAENAREIAGLGRELYDRLGVFAGHFAKIGRALDTAVGSYNQAVGSLESRVLVSARKFEQHGATNGELPEVAPLERTPRPLTAAELTQPELPTADAA
ncbi:MAG TPA: DNA recombination protein RmuC [Gaiellaceae bacterium]|nr:DNA recombination protein RmuC [Gaiellaceae bacterium]